MRCYAVLVGISPGYPPVMGRLHTCYSPVRRSPAEISKLISPLPLDLHVLSLSLAFILSQDQTLRCLSCFLLFLKGDSCRKSPVSHSLKAAPGNLDSGFQELTKKLHLALVLLLMSIVNLSMCSFGLLRFQKRRKTLQSYA